MPLLAIYDDLCAELAGIPLGPPVAMSYQPLQYAREPLQLYLHRYATPGPREAVSVGMNPGPWGMAQTGIPFGAVGMVKGWLGIGGAVGRPLPEHPKKPVLGFDCPREEVSGTRFWGWAQARCASPEAFLRRFFVLNYCPLLLLDAAGRNLTPDKLRKADRERLFGPCDRALRRLLEWLRPELAIGIGNFARDRLKAALGPDAPMRIGRLLHPSPASPAANRGWAGEADRQLAGLGIRLLSPARGAPDGGPAPIG